MVRYTCVQDCLYSAKAPVTQITTQVRWSHHLPSNWVDASSTFSQLRSLVKQPLPPCCVMSISGRRFTWFNLTGSVQGKMLLKCLVYFGHSSVKFPKAVLQNNPSQQFEWLSIDYWKFQSFFMGLLWISLFQSYFYSLILWGKILEIATWILDCFLDLDKNDGYSWL